jgi:hypothetical protein
MSNKDRDATNIVRGFSYQRQYAIYYFLKNYNDNDIKEIIEEGKIDNKTYEDITLITQDNRIITYQIKHNSNIQRLCKSNEGLFKTIGNINNINNLRTEYVVSENNKTFDDNLEYWNNLTSIEKKNNIYKLNDRDSNDNNKGFNKCIELFNQKTDEEILNYLDNFFINKGLKYEKLKENIINFIKEIFNYSKEIEIFYIKYKIFEKFDDNIFIKNKTLNINNTINELKKEINEKNITNKKINEEFINYINKYIDSDDNIEFKNIIDEINSFKEFFNGDISNFKEIINTIHKIYNKFNKNNENNENNEFKKKIKKIYIFFCKEMCCFLLKKIVNKNINNGNYNIVCKFISYYYNHSILNKIIFSKKIKEMIEQIE